MTFIASLFFIKHISTQTPPKVPKIHTEKCVLFIFLSFIPTFKKKISFVNISAAYITEMHPFIGKIRTLLGMLFKGIGLVHVPLLPSYFLTPLCILAHKMGIVNLTNFVPVDLNGAWHLTSLKFAEPCLKLTRGRFTFNSVLLTTINVWLSLLFLPK